MIGWWPTKFIAMLVGVLYPSIESYKALKTDNKDDDSQVSLVFLLQSRLDCRAQHSERRAMCLGVGHSARAQGQCACCCVEEMQVPRHQNACVVAGVRAKSCVWLLKSIAGAESQHR